METFNNIQKVLFILSILLFIAAGAWFIFFFIPAAPAFAFYGFLAGVILGTFALLSIDLFEQSI